MIPIVTMTTPRFLPGTIVLLQSLEDNGNLPEDQKIIVIESRPLDWKDHLVLENFSFDFEFRDVRELGDTQEVAPYKWFNSKLNTTSIEWIESIFSKLFVFRITDYPKLIWIDGDMVCYNDITEAYDMPSLSIAKDCAIEMEKIVPEFCNFPMFNTGFFVFEPSQDTFNNITEYGMKHWLEIQHIRPQSDQTMMNLYYWRKQSRDVHLIDQKWNITWKIIGNFPGYFFKLMRDDPKFLHFIGEKPWLISPDRMMDIDDIQRAFIERWQFYFDRAKPKMEI